jgi:hypothetical protein
MLQLLQEDGACCAAAWWSMLGQIYIRNLLKVVEEPACPDTPCSLGGSLLQATEQCDLMTTK